MPRLRLLAIASALLAASLAAPRAQAQGAPTPPDPTLADAPQAPAPSAQPEAPPLPPPPAAERPASRPALLVTGREPEPPQAPYLAPQWGVGLKLGPRYGWIRSPGLDPFSGINMVPGFSLEAQLRIWHRGPTSLWALGNWNVGGASSTTRNLSSSYTYHELLLGLEGHQELSRRFYLLARVAPGAFHGRYKVSPGDLGYSLGDTTWTWGAELSAGAGVLLGSIGDDDWPSARFWLTGDLGYTLSGTTSVRLRPRIDDADELARHGTTRLPDFDASGVLLRFGAGMTF